MTMESEFERGSLRWWMERELRAPRIHDLGEGMEFTWFGPRPIPHERRIKMTAGELYCARFVSYHCDEFCPEH